MFGYRKNNIGFRIASAIVISKFKSVQSHSFLQISRKELDIHENAREILLLSYDRFSSWVLRAERAFLALSSRKVTSDFCAELIDTIAEELKSIEETCVSHPSIFNEKMIDILKIIREYSLKIISIEIKKLEGDAIESAFVKLVELVSDYLQHVLVIAHEISNNCIRKKEEFIGVTRFCSLALNNVDCMSIKNRVLFYKNNCGVKRFLVKNYIEKDLPQEFIDALKSLEVDIVLEENAFQAAVGAQLARPA